MMHEEFERIAGYEVTNEDYNEIIEPMYMALPNISKYEFVKMIDKKRFFGSRAMITINREHALYGNWMYNGGCTCPKELVIQFFGENDWEVYTAERIQLVKGAQA